MGGEGGVHATTGLESEGVVGGQTGADGVTIEVCEATKSVHEDDAATKVVGVLRACQQEGGVLGMGVVGAVFAKHLDLRGEPTVGFNVQCGIKSVENGIADGGLRGVIERARKERVAGVDLGTRIRNGLWLGVVLCVEAGAGGEGESGDESEQRTAKRHDNILQMFDAVGDRLHALPELVLG